VPRAEFICEKKFANIKAITLLIFGEGRRIEIVSKTIMKTSFCLIALLAASAVLGQEVSYSSGPSFYVPVNFDPVSLDMNQDGTADVTFSGEWLATTDFPSSESSIIYYVSGANGAQLLSANGYAQILSTGEAIGNSPEWNAGTVLLTIDNLNNLNNTSSGWLGPLGEKGQGYLGIQFNAADGIHYGWIQVSLSGTDGLPLSPLVMDWAYETVPDKPILAGEKPIYFEATFNAANEVPPNRSPHSGNGSFVLENHVDGYRLSYNLQLDGAFQPTSAGIFGPATPCINARFLIANLGAYSIPNLPPPSFPPIGPVTVNIQRTPIILQPLSVLVYSGQIILSSNQVAELLAGQLYVNFKSAKFRQGELRGEIFPTAPIRFSATLSGRNEIPRNKSIRQGEAAFTLTGNNLSHDLALDANFSWTSIGIYCSPIPPLNSKTPIANLDNLFGVQIPDGGFPNEPGLPGQILYPGQSILNLTDAQVYRLKRGEFYLNVLTSRFPRGEIGGRILPNE